MLRDASNGDLVVPRTRLKLGEKAFSVARMESPPTTGLKTSFSVRLFKTTIPIYSFVLKYSFLSNPRIDAVMRRYSVCRQCTKSAVVIIIEAISQEFLLINKLTVFHQDLLSTAIHYITCVLKTEYIVATQAHYERIIFYSLSFLPYAHWLISDELTTCNCYD